MPGLAAEAVEPQTERFCQPQQGTHPRGAAAGTYRELPQGQPSQDHPCTHARQPSAYTLHGESEREGDAEQPSLGASRRETLPSGCSRRCLSTSAGGTGGTWSKIDRFAPSSKTCGQCGYVYKGLKLSERSWTCPECGTHHDRDFNAACNIKEFGLKALPTERGKVKPVDCPTVDDRPRVLKNRGRKKQEKRGDISLRSSCL